MVTIKNKKPGNDSTASKSGSGRIGMYRFHYNIKDFELLVKILQFFGFDSIIRYLNYMFCLHNTKMQAKVRMALVISMIIFFVMQV